MQKQTQTRPNVIWLLGDQHREQALGISGDENVYTPNIDNLATTGLQLTGAVGGSPLCCPYRGSMLTSVYPHKCVPGHEDQMPPEQPTIAHVFNDAGYNTAYFGKWHVDGFDGSIINRAAKHIIPPERRGGFQTWCAYENNNASWDSWVHGGTGEDAFLYRLPGYETDELTNLFMDYIREQGKEDETSGEQKPFFAVLSVQPPHNPYFAPEAFRKRYTPGQIKLRPNVPNIPHVTEKAKRDLAGYYAMIENWDWNVGRIVQTLAEEGMLYNTQIVLFSDHGDMHGSHGQFNKTTPHEEALRVPFIISGGSQYQHKTGRHHVPVNHVDLAPTTLGLCGISKPKWMEGTDYAHYRVRNVKPPAEPEPDSAYIQVVKPTGHEHSVDKPWRGIVTKDGWKYVCFEGMHWLMFNLNDDPYEQMNLAHNPLYHRERKRLNDMLKEWVIRTEDNFALPEK